MFPWGLSCLSVLGAAGTALLGAGLLLSLAQHLWTLRWTLSRDRASALPLPKGSMGWPFFGETLHWLVQVSRSHLVVLVPQHGPFSPDSHGTLLTHSVLRVPSRPHPVAEGPREHTQPSLLLGCSLEGIVCRRSSPQRNIHTTGPNTRVNRRVRRRFA